MENDDEFLNNREVVVAIDNDNDNDSYVEKASSTVICSLNPNNTSSDNMTSYIKIYLLECFKKLALSSSSSLASSSITIIINEIQDSVLSWLIRVLDKAKIYCDHYRRFLIMGSDVKAATTTTHELDHPRTRYFGFMAGHQSHSDDDDDDDDDDDNSLVINAEYDINEGSQILNDDDDANDGDYDNNANVINNENSNISTQSSTSTVSSSSSNSSSSNSNSNDGNGDDNNEFEKFVIVKKHIKYLIFLAASSIDLPDIYNMSVQAFNMLQVAIESKIMDAFLNTDERLHYAFKNIPKLNNDNDDNNIKNNVTPLVTKDSAILESLKLEQQQSARLLDALNNLGKINNELNNKDNKIKELEELLIKERTANANLRKRKTNVINDNEASENSDENIDANNISTKKLKMTDKNNQ